MENNKNEKALLKIKEEIGKLNDKTNNVYFFVIDTKGYASGSLGYIYHLAKFAKDEGYNVSMLYQSEGKDDDFVGVEAWLGKEYASLPHYDIQSGEVEINASDILFIPEIFSQIMNQTKKLPCKRIAIMQNYDYILAQMPYSAQWGDYGITEAISNCQENADKLKAIFPYVKTTTIDPFIEKMFGETTEPKKMVINVVSHNQDDITRLVKPFYWKFPYFKWVSFRDLRGFSKEKFAESLREGFLTIWLDDPSSFGYSALEAIKSGNVVFARMPETPKSWMKNEDGVGFNNSCIWFDTIEQMHDPIATMVRAFITDSIQPSLYEGQEDVKKLYKEEDSKKQFMSYLSIKFEERIKAFEELVKIGERENKEINEEKA